MPALPLVPNVIRVRFGWTIGADLSADTNLYFAYTGAAPDEAQAVSLAAQCYTAMATASDTWTGDTVLASCRVTDLSGDDTGDGVHSASTPGTRSGGDLPAATSLLVNYQIGRRYRGGKPRSYLPWGADTDLGSRQRWSADFIASAITRLTTVFADIVGASAGTTTVTGHVNVSYYQGFTVEGGTGGKRAKNVSTPRAVPLVNAVVGFAPNIVIGSQRRRNRPGA